MLSTNNLDNDSALVSSTFQAGKLGFKSFLSARSFFFLFANRESEPQVPSFFILNDNSGQIRFHLYPLLFQDGYVGVSVEILTIGKWRVSEKTDFLIGVIDEVNKNVGNQLVFVERDAHGFFDVPAAKPVDGFFSVGLHFEMSALDAQGVGFVFLVQVESSNDIGSNLEPHFFLFGQAAFELYHFPFRS